MASYILIILPHGLACTGLNARRENEFLHYLRTNSISLPLFTAVWVLGPLATMDMHTVENTIMTLAFVFVAVVHGFVSLGLHVVGEEDTLKRWKVWFHCEEAGGPSAWNTSTAIASSSGTWEKPGRAAHRRPSSPVASGAVTTETFFNHAVVSALSSTKRQQESKAEARSVSFSSSAAGTSNPPLYTRPACCPCL